MGKSHNRLSNSSDSSQFVFSVLYTFVHNKFNANIHCENHKCIYITVVTSYKNFPIPISFSIFLFLNLRISPHNLKQLSTEDLWKVQPLIWILGVFLYKFLANMGPSNELIQRSYSSGWPEVVLSVNYRSTNWSFLKTSSSFKFT